jgi:hypothetical protein
LACTKKCHVRSRVVIKKILFTGDTEEKKF